MMNENSMPGPALSAAIEVKTKMPVPITAPMPSMVRSKAPRERLSDLFSAAAIMSSNGLTRQPMVFSSALFGVIAEMAFVRIKTWVPTGNHAIYCRK